MASLYKRANGYYYLAFYDANQHPPRKQVALKTKVKRVAERKQRRLEDDFALGQYDPWDAVPSTSQVPTPTVSLDKLGEAISAFLDSRAHLSPYTVERYRSVLHNLREHVGPSLSLQAVTADRLTAYLASTNTKTVTKHSYARALRTFFNWLAEAGAVTDNPVEQLRLERAPQKHPRFLTLADVDAICSAIEGRDRSPKVTPGTSRWLLPVVRANVYLGLRAGEVVNLRWEHIDLDRKTLLVANTEAFTTKGGRERVLPLSEYPHAVLAALERRSEWVFPNYGGTQLHRLYLSRRFKHFARLADLPEHVNFHTTRHTCASWLAQAGCSIEAIRLYMGHSSIAVTQRYMHLSSESLASQVERAFR